MKAIVIIRYAKLADMLELIGNRLVSLEQDSEGIISAGVENRTGNPRQLPRVTYCVKGIISRVAGGTDSVE